jgi:hypothetical protein
MIFSEQFLVCRGGCKRLFMVRRPRKFRTVDGAAIQCARFFTRHLNAFAKVGDHDGSQDPDDGNDNHYLQEREAPSQNCFHKLCEFSLGAIDRPTLVYLFNLAKLKKLRVDDWSAELR